VTVNRFVVPLAVPRVTVPVLPASIAKEGMFPAQFVTLTVNPVAVDTGVSNVGISPVRSDVPVTVPIPDAYPVLVVTTFTVDDTPASNPVTVNGRIAPAAVPAVTAPVLPDGIDGVNVYEAL